MGLVGRGAVFGCALLLATAPVGGAQSSAAEPIADVIRDADGDFVPDRLGETVSVVGVATTFRRAARDGIDYVVIQDDSAAIRILTDDESLLVEIGPGTIVEVVGLLTHRRGVEELFIETLRITGATSPPVPREVLISDLLSERYTQQLVRVTGNLTIGNFTGDDTLGEVVTDRSGSIPVRITDRFRQNVDLLRGLLDVDRVEIIGIAGQSDLEAPFDGGYRLAPREPPDIVFVPVFPYQAVGFGALLVALLATILALWTKRRSAEHRADELAERHGLESQLLQAQKMEALGRMAGGIAHDLNNMLTTVMGTADMLLEKTSEQRMSDGLTWIREASERSADLSRRLLELSRQRITQPRVIDVNEELRELVPVLRGMIRADVEFVSAPGPTPSWIKIDPTQLKQVFLNLALNANEAMPKGGRLLIETARVPAGGPGDEARSEPRTEALIRVVDSGTGIASGTIEHIFEPFFSTKETGSGLGLSIVYGIVKRVGGRIEAKSEPGRGTTFEIHIPEAEREKRDGPATPAPVAGVEGSGTILLVEDDPHVRGLARHVLERAGYTVVEAADGEEAKRAFQSAPDSFDLLLTDVVMPNVGGAELAEYVAAARPDLPVVFMSGFVDDAEAGDYIAKHNAEFLQKPWQVADLLATVGGIIPVREPR